MINTAPEDSTDVVDETWVYLQPYRWYDSNLTAVEHKPSTVRYKISRYVQYLVGEPDDIIKKIVSVTGDVPAEVAYINSGCPKQGLARGGLPTYLDHSYLQECDYCHISLYVQHVCFNQGEITVNSGGTLSIEF